MTGVIRLNSVQQLHRIFFQIFLFLALFSLFVLAQDSDSVSLEDTGFYEETGLDPAALQGCETGCTYEGSVLTLTEGASLTLTDIPDDLIIETDGGTITLPEGDKIMTGTLDTATMTLTDGNLKLASPSFLDMTFKESSVVLFKGVSVEGNGIIEDGELTFVERGELAIQDSDPFFVQNLNNPQFETGDDTIILTGYIDDHTKIGTGKDYVSMQAGYGDRFVYDPSLKMMRCESDCNYDVYGSPEIFLVGSKMKQTQYVDKDGNVDYAYNERLNTRTVSFDGGKQHVFEGEIYITDNSFFFARDADPFSVHSIDGIYVNTQDTTVQVFFEKPEVLAGNYMVVADTYVRMGGVGYAVAFGDVGGGNPTLQFPYSFTEQNAYIDTEETESSFRLLSTFHGGELVYYNEEFHVTKPGVTMVNGVNAFVYQEAAEGTTYDYFYVPCITNPPGPNLHASCGEVNVNMIDGGKVNVVQELGTGYTLEEEKDVLEFKTDAFLIGNNLQYPEKEHHYELDTSKVYVLGYKGGAAAEALAGKELAYKEWGHVGLMYYKAGQWWVAEETGVAAKIRPFEKSLFARQTDGVYEVLVEDPTPIISAAERVAGADYKHYDPVTLPLPFDDLYRTAKTKYGSGFTCSGFCEFTLEASPEIEEAAPGYGVSFADFTQQGTEVEIWNEIMGTIAAQVETTPRKLLVDNPNLKGVPNLAAKPDEEEIVKLSK